MSEEEPLNILISEKDKAIQDARAWFGPQDEFEVSNVLGTNSRGETQLKTLRWASALAHEEGNIVEIPLDYNFHAIPTSEDKSIESIHQKQKDSFYRVILKSDQKGGFRPYILKFFPSKSATNQNKTYLNNYSIISSDFSGKVELTDWNEKLIKAWRVSNGMVVGYITPIGNVSKNRSTGQNLSQQGCTTYTETYCYMYEDAAGRVIECYEHTPVVECEQDSAYEDEASGGSNWNQNDWHGFWPGFGSGGNSEQAWQNYIAGISNPHERRQAQLEYLRNHGGSEFVAMIEEMMVVGGLNMGDISEINNLVNRIYLQQRGKFIMAIFSPENFSQILLLYSTPISSPLRSRVFELIPRFANQSNVNILLPLGKGSTGRFVANNLTEKLAMKEIMANPAIGKVIPNMPPLTDSRWMNWSKMQYIHNGLNGQQTVIHYVAQFENGIMKYVDNFKFVSP
ncbi:hypothetical protein [Algoriphagus namhaensis]